MDIHICFIGKRNVRRKANERQNEIEAYPYRHIFQCGGALTEIETIFLEQDRLFAVLPELILKRVPYRIVIKELDVPAYRKIGIALRSKKTVSLAVKRFLDYLQYR